MKGEELALILVGVGIAGYVGYTIASKGKPEEQLKKIASNITNVPQVVSQYVEKIKEVPTIKETITKEVQVIKESVANVPSQVGSIVSNVSSGFTNFVDKGSKTLNEITQNLKPKTQILPKSEPSPLSVAGFERAQQILTEDIEKWKQMKDWRKYVVVPSMILTRDITLNLSKFAVGIPTTIIQGLGNVANKVHNLFAKFGLA